MFSDNFMVTVPFYEGEGINLKGLGEYMAADEI